MKFNRKIFSCLSVLLIFTLSSAAKTESASDEKTKYLIPGGESIGVTLETAGVLVSAVSEVTTTSGTVKSPAADCGLKGGDLIKTIDQKAVSSVEELCEVLSHLNGEEVELTFMRGEKMHTSHITPVQSSDTKEFCIGAWVKDAASGIGTLTYIDAENKTFAALGHGICNPDTGKLIPVEDGEILKSEIVSVQKGEKGIPGELKGVFTEDKEIMGTIKENSSSGLFGITSPEFESDKEALPIGHKEEIKKGKAYIYTCVASDKPSCYEVEILRVFGGNSSDSKDMIIKITDENLIEKTGGIVQGMSGSPILQNGKLIGAVTHVFVNDPAKGYGIFIENMLSEAEKIK